MLQSTHFLHLELTSAWLEIKRLTSSMWPPEAAQCKGSQDLYKINKRKLVVEIMMHYSSSFARISARFCNKTSAISDRPLPEAQCSGVQNL
jgi:hypothetical protein